ncbi:MAG: phosphatidylglycerol lysyltransferase domain-containing protein [Eubacteriales bacterium]|nr:phosphatidylglycerol lysyltransferase domain-containing protein [Eubacteriales bacterium]
MLEFKKPEIEDKQWADQCLKNAKSMNCEYTFGNIFIWSTAYSEQICRYKDFFICRWGRGEDISYSAPIGTGDFKDAMEQIIADAKMQGVTPEIYGVTEHYKELINKYFPGMFSFEYDEGYNDYIYSVEKMASLSGKKYHGKRNHITNFKKNNPNWSFEKIDSSNINDCIELHTKWISDKEQDNADEDSDYSYEFEAVLTAFENFDALGLTGGLIRIDGKAIAYTVGEKKSDDVFVTHFEKAPADIQGAYPVINQEFTKNCLMEYKYVNREEDLGIPGLRKAKQSYYPEIFLEKCVAVYNG